MSSNIFVTIDGNNVVAFIGTKTKRVFRNNLEWKAFLAEGEGTSFLCSSSIDFPEDSGMSGERLKAILGDWEQPKAWKDMA